MSNVKSRARLFEDIAVLVVRVGVASIFIYSAWHKLAVDYPFAFMTKVNQYEIMPAEYVYHFSLVLPWLMLAGAISLLLGLASRAGAGGTGLLLVSFIVALASRYGEPGCGCFSYDEDIIGWPLIAFDSLLFLLMIFIAIRGPGAFSLDRLVKSFLKARREKTRSGADE